MFMSQYIDTQVSQVRLTMQKTLANFEKDLTEEQREINAHKGSSGGHLERWKTKQGVYQLEDPVAMNQVETNTEEATYAEVLRDV